MSSLGMAHSHFQKPQKGLNRWYDLALNLPLAQLRPYGVDS